MGLNLKLGLGINSGGAAPRMNRYALTFNGTDEYLTRSLPTNLLTGNTNDFTSAGSRPTGWGTGSGETWNQTGITGSTSTNVLKLTGTNAYAVYGGLTIGKKYKLKLRWYGDNTLRVGSTSTGTQYYSSGATTQWNTIYDTFVATSANLYLSIASGTIYIDLFNITEDWKLDLNESYELIKHSMNRDFETILVTTYASNFSAGTDSWTVYSGNGGVVTGNIDSIAGENDCLKFTANAELQYQIAAKAINQVVGKKYILRCKVYIPSTNAVIKKVSVFTNSDYGIGTNNIETYDQWVSFEKEGIALNNATNWFYPLTAGGSAINNGSANGDVFYLKDVQIYEIPNLVTNGTFEDTGSWSGINTNNWDYDAVGKKLTITNTPSAALTHTGFQGIAGKRYRITMKISDYTAGDLIFEFGSAGNQVTFNAPIGDGVKTVDYTPNQSGYFRFIAWQNFRGSIDNIHIYEIPEWTATGNHTANLTLADKYAGSGSLLVTATGAGDATTNHVKLPSAQIETLVSGNKYTYEGFAKTDASSLSYGANVLSGDDTNFTSGVGSWLVGNGSGASVGGEYILSSTGTGYIYRTLTSANKILKVTFKAKSVGYTGQLRVYHNSTTNEVRTSNVSTEWQTFTVYCNSHTATATFYISLLTSHTGDVLFDDITIQEATPITFTKQIGTKSVTITPSISAYTKFVLNFECTASEVGQDIKTYLSGAGSVYLDSVSLTQAYDMVRAYNINPTVSEKRAIFSHSSTNFTECKANGYIKATVSDGTNTITNEALTQYTTGTTQRIIQTLSRTDKLYLTKNGTTDAGVSATTLGKTIQSGKLNIGANSSNAELFSGQIGSIMFIRFTKIEGNFDASTYIIGQTITGGGAEVVLWFDPRFGGSVTDMLKDYSNNGNNLTAVNIDTTNRVRITT